VRLVTPPGGDARLERARSVAYKRMRTYLILSDMPTREMAESLELPDVPLNPDEARALETWSATGTGGPRKG
jgi:hypothetical protein